MVTFSRRTPPRARDVIARALADVPGWIWEGEGANPYFAFLGAADAFVVTEDSINMVAEAASTGKPIYIATVDGGQRRKRLFHADLERKGVIRPFTGDHAPWTYAPLRETERLADEVVRQLGARRRTGPPHPAPANPVVGRTRS
jgi:mitochondrial fission protein ELM1